MSACAKRETGSRARTHPSPRVRMQAEAALLVSPREYETRAVKTMSAPRMLWGLTPGPAHGDGPILHRCTPLLSL